MVPCCVVPHLVSCVYLITELSFVCCGVVVMKSVMLQKRIFNDVRDDLLFFLHATCVALITSCRYSV